MKIEHLAMWVSDLEKMKDFYETWFEGKAGELYINPVKNFRSYFLSFAEGPRLELMQMPGILPKPENTELQSMGFVHMAVSVGSREKVDTLTRKLREAGYTVAGEPRTTGDGYYESVILDPEGNRVEITI